MGIASNFYGNVVGGVGEPIFILLGDELVREAYPTSVDTFVTSAPSSTGIEDVDSSIYGASAVYCILGGLNTKVKSLVRNVNREDLSGRTLFLSVIVSSPETIENLKMYAEVETSLHTYLTTSATDDITIQGTQAIFSRALVPTIPAGESVTSIKLVIESINTQPVKFNVLFMSVSVETLSVEFETEQSYSIEFVKEVYSKVTLANGHIKEYIKGWRPTVNYRYEYISKAFETFRQYMSDSNNIVVIPRGDYDLHLFVIWEGDFLRDFSFGKYIGHKADIKLESKILYQNKEITALDKLFRPVTISDKIVI